MGRLKQAFCKPPRYFLAIEGDARAVFFGDNQAGELLDVFVSGEAAHAGQATPPAADGPAALGGAGINDLVAVFAAEGASHDRQYRAGGAGGQRARMGWLPFSLREKVAGLPAG